MGKNSDRVMGRHEDGEKKFILLRFPKSPFLRVLFYLPILPVFQPSIIPAAYFFIQGGSLTSPIAILDGNTTTRFPFCH